MGYESRCKAELASHHPELKFAFGRPGLLTFKVADDSPLRQELVLKSTFARTFGYSMTTIQGSLPVDLIETHCKTHGANLVHYWSRSDQDRQLNEAGEASTPNLPRLNIPGIRLNKNAKSGETVIDVIEIDHEHWLIGYHQAAQTFQRWRAGKPMITCQEPVVSRAYNKTAEALQWSRLPIRAGDICVEIGAAPGGSAQALLQRGCSVLAIDPADMDERLFGYPRLQHIKKRGKDVPKKSFAGARWLFADLNVAPKLTLDTVEEIVTNDAVHFRGMVLTLKSMSESGDAKQDSSLFPDEIAGIVDRVRGWGMRFVKTRQLAYNRNEICLLALKQKALLRARARK